MNRVSGPFCDHEPDVLSLGHVPTKPSIGVAESREEPAGRSERSGHASRRGAPFDVVLGSLSLSGTTVRRNRGPRGGPQQIGHRPVRAGPERALRARRAASFHERRRISVEGSDNSMAFPSVVHWRYGRRHEQRNQTSEARQDRRAVIATSSRPADRRCRPTAERRVVVSRVEWTRQDLLEGLVGSCRRLDTPGAGQAASRQRPRGDHDDRCFASKRARRGRDHLHCCRRHTRRDPTIATMRRIADTCWSPDGKWIASPAARPTSAMTRDGVASAAQDRAVRPSARQRGLDRRSPKPVYVVAADGTGTPRN